MEGKRKLTTVVAVFAALSLVLAACSTATKTPTAKTGGILRAQTDGFEWNANLDPTAEYLGFAWEFLGGMFLRGLFSYNHKDGAHNGNQVFPDLAVNDGTVSADGMTYTFKIKPNVKWGPPLKRNVTTKDIAYAFARASNDTLSAGGYASSYYLPVIKGMTEVESGKATTVSGIETPDDTTIIFHLTHPQGDFRSRLALPTAAPIPEEVAKCFTKNGDYGRYLVSDGPYMLQGSELQGDPTTGGCSVLKPIAGFDPVNFLKIRRNPNYDASTDSKDLRENNIDGIDLTLNTNDEDMFQRAKLNQLDYVEATVPNATIAQYQADPTLAPNLRIDPGDRTWYVFMDMTQAPFDDVHVRRAVNWVLDKAAMVKARGGAAAGVVAEHIVPPTVLGALNPGEFDPYASPGEHGDAAKALAEMKLSKYKVDATGKCIDPKCKNVLHITRNTAPYPDLAPLEENALAKIGITLNTKEIPKFYATVQVPSQTPPLGSGAGWGKDFADAETFFVPLLSSSAILPGATQNFAYLGLTAAQATKIGKKYPAGGVPSIDADIDHCQTLNGAERTTCWADLDKKTMTEDVPWVPYLWANNVRVTGSAVTNYMYDLWTGVMSFAHISIDAAKQLAG